MVHAELHAHRDEKKLLLIKQRVRAAMQHSEGRSSLLKSTVISEDGKSVKAWNMPSLQSDDGEFPGSKLTAGARSFG